MAVLAVLAALLFVVWRVPSALFIVVGGFALATLLSFPVRELCSFVPRRFRGLGVLSTFLALIGVIVGGAFFVIPRLVAQFSTLSEALPLIAEAGRRYLLGGLEWLDEAGLLRSAPEHVASRIERPLR